MSSLTLGIVGNPNCGKTTLFNALTGSRQHVGNWPGVTVDRKSGICKYKAQRIELIDTPGIYSLSASSVDERVTRDFLLSKEARLIINIVDASNLERNLYLTSQLLEMEVPLVLALNMTDIAEKRGMSINCAALEAKLGVPVIPLIAAENNGVEALIAAVVKEAAEVRRQPSRRLYPEDITSAIEQLVPLITSVAEKNGMAPAWLAARLLENDEQALALFDQRVLQITDTMRAEIEKKIGEETDIAIASAHYQNINHLVKDTVSKSGTISDSLSDRIDRVALHRLFGIPLFLVAMYFTFMLTINVGGAFIDFFDIFFGAIFVEGVTELLNAVSAPAWLVAILANGIGGGIQTMATFIPPIGFMFLCLSFLEDSGYMARAAFVMDRLMRLIGLPGKSFIPMVVGFGCNVPAIMATRTLDNERDRTLTIMMNPFMSCGARLPVYALFAAAFFPSGGQNLVFLLYLIGIGFAVLTGLVLKNTLLRGEVTPFVMELPPYHLPSWKSVVLRAYERLKTFIFKAGKVLIPVIAVLAFLNTYGSDGSFGNEDTDKSLLASMSKTITPVLYPIGVTEDNWPATVGIFTGIFAKEAVVGTLDSLYKAMDAAAAGESEAEETFSLTSKIAEAFASIPAGLSGIGGSLLDPLGIGIGDVSDQQAAAEEQGVSSATFGSMVTLFGSQAAAFAYLLFVLLYFPCSAAIAAVYRETNLAWTIFIGFWTTLLAYLAATLFYQLATFALHPLQTLTWVAVGLTVFTMVVLGMRYYADRRPDALAVANAGRA
jgi:ferrous iron transport protein B